MKQFQNTLRGDRFFFTHTGQTGSFSQSGRQMLINRSLAGVICDNTAIQKVKQNVFELESASNPFVECSTIAQLTDVNTLIGNN